MYICLLARLSLRPTQNSHSPSDAGLQASSLKLSVLFTCLRVFFIQGTAIVRDSVAITRFYTFVLTLQVDHGVDKYQSRLSVWTVAQFRNTTVIELISLSLPLTRFRPQNSLELREGGEIVVAFDDNLQTVQMRSAALASGPEKDGFTFDRIFPLGAQQHEVFDYGVKE
jgi:hypothetical protein